MAAQFTESGLWSSTYKAKALALVEVFNMVCLLEAIIPLFASALTVLRLAPPHPLYSLTLVLGTFECARPPLNIQRNLLGGASCEIDTSG